MTKTDKAGSLQWTTVSSFLGLASSVSRSLYHDPFFVLVVCCPLQFLVSQFLTYSCRCSRFTLKCTITARKFFYTDLRWKTISVTNKCSFFFNSVQVLWASPTGRKTVLFLRYFRKKSLKEKKKWNLKPKFTELEIIINGEIRIVKDAKTQVNFSHLAWV